MNFILAMFANHKVCNILLLVVLEWKEDLDIYDTLQWQWSGVCLRWLAVCCRFGYSDGAFAVTPFTMKTVSFSKRFRGWESSWVR